MSSFLEPKFSPLMVTLVPGRPSLGDMPLTSGHSLPLISNFASGGRSTPMAMWGVARHGAQLAGKSMGPGPGEFIYLDVRGAQLAGKIQDGKSKIKEAQAEAGGKSKIKEAQAEAGGCIRQSESANFLSYGQQQKKVGAKTTTN